MTVRLNPYLNYRAKAREVMTFYHSVFGGKLDIMTFGDAQMAHNPEDNDLVMHSMLTTDNGLVLMGSDVPTDMELTLGGSFSISLSGDDEPTLTGYWEKLADGAEIEAPLNQAPWGATFGMLTDRYGTRWLVNIGPEDNA